jgi:hypothetical protein
MNPQRSRTDERGKGSRENVVMHRTGFEAAPAVRLVSEGVVKAGWEDRSGMHHETRSRV